MKGSKLIIGILVAIILYLLWWIGTHDSSSQSSSKPEKIQNLSNSNLESQNQTPNPVSNQDTSLTQKNNKINLGPVKTIDVSGGFTLQEQSTGACQSLIPQDWRAISSARSDTADFMSNDGTMYAGYGVLGVNPTMQVYDSELYSNDPEVSIRRMTQVIAQNAFGDQSYFAYTGEYNQQIGEYRLRSLESAASKGVVFYRTFPGDGINSSYIEVARFGLARKDVWNQKGMLIARIAASIQCTTQFEPRESPVVGGGTDRNTSDENGSDEGYNPQLGTEYVHDDNGTNYLVSPSLNWSSDGPEGEGYYKQNGNDVAKLKPGRSD